MKLLVDAQLTRQLARELVNAGHDVLHTLDLQSGNRTPDDQIIGLARLPALESAFAQHDFIELNMRALVIHI